MKIILHRNSRPASPGHLTRKQSLRFAMLDERVRASATSLANDLEEIKRDKLYLAKFPTWEAYCAEVRQIGGRHGNRLIDYVEVKTTLIEAGLEAPASERHAREVKGTKAQQVATWAEVKRRESNGAKITGDLVREINQEILHPPEAEAIARKSRITDAARATIMKAQRNRYPERFPQETPAADPLSQEPPSISVGTLAPGVLPLRNPDPEPDPEQANNNSGDGRPWQFTKPLKSPAPVPEPAKDPLDPKTTGEEIVELLVQLSWTTDSRHVHVSLNRMRQYLEEQRQWRAQRDAENAPKKAA